MGIQYQKVSYGYQGVKSINHALKDVTTDISADKDFIAVLGHTGAGKSTFAQLANALILPSSGKMQIFNQELPPKRGDKINHLRQKVGLVFQFPEYQLFETTILKDVMFGPSNFKNTKPHALELAQDALTKVGISSALYEQSPFRISGGQMRRVAIAGILSMNPNILVLDEPTRGLDPQGKDEVMDIFVKLHQEEKKSIILITHDMDLVAKYAKRVIVLKDGAIVYDGPKEELFTHPQFDQFSLDYPQAMKILKHLNQTLKIPFKPVFTYEELTQYLREVLK